MTGADTPSITVRQYGDAASIRSLIIRQPDNTEFLLCWKGKYIVGITHVPAEQHFNVRYEYDNSAVIAHDFFADDPYPGVLTIEASESSDPTPVADFETELRAFLQTIGVSNVTLSRIAQLSWWNSGAAFYEVILHAVPYGNEAWINLVMSGAVGNSRVMSFNGYVVRITKHSEAEIDVDVLCCTEPVEGSAETKHFNVGTEAQGYAISDIVCRESEDIFDSVITPIEEMLSDSTDYSTNAWHGVTSGFDIYDNIPYTDY